MRIRKLLLPGLTGLAVVVSALYFFPREKHADPVSQAAAQNPPISQIWPDHGPSASSPPPAPELVDGSPEARLVGIFHEIEQRNLNRALELTEALLQQHPNYRLAHLIKGDLLLARTRPIENFGAAQGAPAERVADLRAEALKRLQGYREKPAANSVPRYLVQMRPDQRYAVVIDTQRSRLYLYENDLQNGGRPRFVADYYVTQGKLGADKLAEGDKKTPIGVYHVTADLSRQKLPDLYGNGAFPIRDR